VLRVIIHERQRLIASKTKKANQIWKLLKMKNLNKSVYVAICVLAVTLGCKQAKVDNDAAPVASQTINTSTSANTVESVSTIKWSDYDNVYNIKSESTDMQKEALWKRFEGQTVTWQGTVSEFSEGMLGGYLISIEMNPDTPTGDIILTLKENQKEKVASLTKGEKISFVGKLKTHGGATLPLLMDEGEIK
jgi:hypothetical protein